jgi:hypothetical protein
LKTFKRKQITRLKNSSQNNKLKRKLRPKWDQHNSLMLYQNYFLNFSFDTFHTFSYLSGYLEPIFYNSLYEQAYIDFFIQFSTGGIISSTSSGLMATRRGSSSSTSIPSST